MNLLSDYFVLTEPEEPPDRARRNSVKSDDLEHFDATIKARVKAAVALGADAIVVSASELATARGRVDARATVPKPNLQPDFNVSVFECFDTSSSTGLRELDESDRSVQKSAESTSI